MLWTSEETSWSLWTRTARSSVLQHASTISHTWGMRRVNTEQGCLVCLVVLRMKCISPCLLILVLAMFCLLCNPRCVRWVRSSLSRQSSWCATISCSRVWRRWKSRMKRWDCTQVSWGWRPLQMDIQTESYSDEKLGVAGSLQCLCICIGSLFRVPFNFLPKEII